MDAWLILPALRGRPVRRPTMYREKSNLTTGHTFAEPPDFSTLKKSREWRGLGRCWGGRVLLGGWPVTRYSAFDGSHCGGECILSRGPGLHSPGAGSLELG